MSCEFEGEYDRKEKYHRCKIDNALCITHPRFCEKFRKHHTHIYECIVCGKKV